MSTVASTLDMATGIVKFYNRSREFGFITGDDGVDRFFNSNQLRAEKLAQGDKVKFVSSANAKGPIACRVQIVA
ncbi:cold shock domain-containing protein [Rugamonas sp. A1-17]|nr:cold shock domain-containing protein [Rugamonas sp. A1-17]